MNKFKQRNKQKEMSALRVVRVFSVPVPSKSLGVDFSSKFVLFLTKFVDVALYA